MQMLLALHGKRISQKKLARMAKTTKSYGTKLRNVVHTIKRFKINAKIKRRASIGQLKKSIARGHPVIVDRLFEQDNEGHYAIVVSIAKKFITLNDPWFGKKRYSIKRFKNIWFDPCDKVRNRAIFVQGKQENA